MTLKTINLRSLSEWSWSECFWSNNAKLLCDYTSELSHWHYNSPCLCQLRCWLGHMAIDILPCQLSKNGLLGYQPQSSHTLHLNSFPMSWIYHHYYHAHMVCKHKAVFLLWKYHKISGNPLGILWSLIIFSNATVALLYGKTKQTQTDIMDKMPS